MDATGKESSQRSHTLAYLESGNRPTHRPSKARATPCPGFGGIPTTLPGYLPKCAQWAKPAVARPESSPSPVWRVRQGGNVGLGLQLIGLAGFVGPAACPDQPLGGVSTR